MSMRHFPAAEASSLSPLPVVEARQLTRRFGTFVAVDHIDFSIKGGEVVAFLGPNGAGKTTTIKMLTGLLRPTEGKAFLLGYDVQEYPGLIKDFVGYMSQRFSLYPLLTAAENVGFFAGIVGLRPREIRIKLKELEKLLPPGLLHQKARDLPPGIKQEVALFACLLSDPKIIFLDEPTSGWHQREGVFFWIKIYELKKQGKTVLVSTHNLDEAEYADRVIIIHQGKIRFQGELGLLFHQEGVANLEEFFLTSLSLVREKETGSVQLLFISRLRSAEIINGKTLPYLVFSFLVGLIIFIFSHLFFGLELRGSSLYLLASVLLYLISGLSLGILISTAAPSQKAAMIMTLLGTILPSIFLSGFIFPLESLSPLLRAFSYLIPATYFLRILRGVALKGAGFHDFLTEAGVPLGMSLFWLSLSIRKFQAMRRPWQ